MKLPFEEKGNGGDMQFVYKVERVPRDTDMFRVVHHSVYDDWVYAAMCKLLRSRRISPRSLVVRELSLSGFRGIRFNEDVEVAIEFDHRQAVPERIAVEFLVKGRTRATGWYVFGDNPENDPVCGMNSRWDTIIEISPREISESGGVAPATYCCWVERAMKRWVDEQQMEMGSYSLTVRSLNLSGFRRIRPEDEEATIGLLVTRIQAAQFQVRIGFRVKDELRAEGTYTFACVQLDDAGLRAAVIPEFFKKKLRALLDEDVGIIDVSTPPLAGKVPA